ncbi:MAG: polysialyltransferase family glycosyltransferase [bacterium]|nr:polysialyltransferase family glycosyltransferase [bacterium]
MKRIVFYVKHLAMLPAWVDPVAPFLIDSGYDIVVLHASTLNRDTAGKPTRGKVPYTCIEIGDKDMAGIVGVIEELKPLAIIMFTFRSLFDLLLVRVARHCSAPSVYVQHGFHISTKFQMADKKASLIRYYNFVKWYVYFLFIIKRSDLIHELSLIYRAMFKIDYAKTRFDYALFYSPGGLKDAAQYFDFEPSQAFFSGYPLSQKADDVKRLLGRSRRHKSRRIVYVHQPFILDRFTHIDHTREFAFLDNIATICQEREYEFVIKIHPRESPARYTSGLRNRSAVIETSTTMTDILTDCAVVIGHFSTALFTGILLGKPIIVMDYPGLDNFYYSLFEPVAFRVHNEKDLDRVLKNGDICRHREADYEHFIHEHIGQHNNCEHRASTIAAIVEGAAIRSV